MIANHFVEKYFNGDEYLWIGGNIGEVAMINDYYMHINEMVDYLRFNYTTEQLLEHYDYVLQTTSWNLDHKDEKQKAVVNIKNYLKLKPVA